MYKNLMLFTEKLKKLCKKHNILLSGRLRVLNVEDYLSESQLLEFAEILQDGLTTDRTGPFLLLSAEKKPQEIAQFTKPRFGSAMLNIDKDKLLKDGIKSPIDGSLHTNRKTYGDHLRAHDCVEVGNDWNGNQAKFVANHEFDDKGIQEATSRAVDEVFERKKIKALR